MVRFAPGRTGTASGNTIAAVLKDTGNPLTPEMGTVGRWSGGGVKIVVI